jgi:mannose/fructose/N-acetylgalactosamine-specific phosphotransferase system component IIC
VRADYIGHEAHIGATATVLTVAVPVAVFGLALSTLYTYLVDARVGHRHMDMAVQRTLTQQAMGIR